MFPILNQELKGRNKMGSGGSHQAFIWQQVVSYDCQHIIGIENIETSDLKMVIRFNL